MAQVACRVRGSNSTVLYQVNLIKITSLLCGILASTAQFSGEARPSDNLTLPEAPADYTGT